MASSIPYPIPDIANSADAKAVPGDWESTISLRIILSIFV